MNQMLMVKNMLLDWQKRREAKIVCRDSVAAVQEQDTESVENINCLPPLES
jgi:hypothetical protein